MIESPELRRIFDEEPAKIRGRKATRTAAERSRGSPDDGGGRLDRSRSSRKRRIVVGLAPLYLAGVILFFESVREPSILLQAFGSSSVAEEAPARASAAIITAAAPEKALKVESRQDAAPAEIDRSAAASAAPDQTSPASTKTKVAVTDAQPGSGTDKSAIDENSVVDGKSAIDLAKRAPHRPVHDFDLASLDLPSEIGIAGVAGANATAEASPAEGAGATPSIVFGSNRPLAGLPYPDPPAGAVAGPETIDPAAAEAAEDALRLSRGDKREVQRRLRLASADPKAIDGIFGPATRSAIAAWQEKAGLTATGFMDEAAMALLVEQTADAYRAWRAAERARAREREAQSAVVASSALPAPRTFRPEEDDEACRRMASGEIAFGRDVRCNFRGFGENLKRDFRNLKGELRELFD